jgi:hypothetical protein
MTTTCSECGAEILERTAAKTGGKCMPCWQGTRADIEESKRRTAEERGREAVNQAALERLRTKQRPTYQDFLAQEDPVGVLLQFLGENIERLAPGARSLYLVAVLDGEVVNGGFHQYFSNSSGQYAHETLAGLVEVGAASAAKLLQEAIRAFPSKRVPVDWSERNEQLDQVDSALLGDLDDKYYALADDGTEDLASLILAFMKRHAGEPIAA